ncbi:MAG: hypothetical protein V7K55_15815 [Nostoc sp.]|uniref:hypothetical protein n=1 Tax=Nostoc sp. TaxID=1180 RepID=UPI002FF488F9
MGIPQDSGIATYLLTQESGLFMLAGTILQDGKYTLIQEIGRGGFGITFSAIRWLVNHGIQSVNN